MAKNDITINTTNTYGTITAKDIEMAMNQLKSIDYTTSYYPYGIGKIKTEPEDKGVEEWVWVTGYKGTEKDMKCRDYQYEMNKQHDMPEGSEIDICCSGFHFCDKIRDVFRYYDVARGNRFFEVKALVRRWNKNGYYTIEHQRDKMAAKSIQFVRELTTEEIFEHLNNDLTVDWTVEQMNAARQTSIIEYNDILRTEKLVQLGYSEAFATWAVRKGGYDVAKMMGETPNVGMDVKVMAVCMDIYD